MMSNEFTISIFSDMHKDVYGFRPRGLLMTHFMNMSAQEKAAQLDYLEAQLTRQIEDDKWLDEIHGEPGELVRSHIDKLQAETPANFPFAALLAEKEARDYAEAQAQHFHEQAAMYGPTQFHMK